MSTADDLERLLDPVARCFNRDVAQSLLSIQPDPGVESRIEELAERANEGALSSDELEEYKNYVDAMDLIGILSAKAAAILREPA